MVNASKTNTDEQSSEYHLFPTTTGGLWLRPLIGSSDLSLGASVQERHQRDIESFQKRVSELQAMLANRDATIAHLERENAWLRSGSYHSFPPPPSHFGHEAGSSKGKGIVHLTGETAGQESLAEEKVLLKTEMCRDWTQRNKCDHGVLCKYAHEEAELYRPVKRHPLYKTKVCKWFAATGACAWGDQCDFLHSEQ